MSLLVAKSITKSYPESNGKLEVLTGVDLILKEGETCVITGESGSGKSTLLHIMGMLDSPDSGSIYYSGELKKSTDRDINRFRNQEIGFVFQFHYLLEDFTAEENAAMPMFLATKNYQRSIKKAREMLKMLSLSERCSHYPNQLSGGELQRVAFARALINQPRIVFADEPTGNLDAHHSAEMIDLILDLNQKMGQAYIIVTHDQKIAAQMQSHYLLENGVLSKEK